MINITRVSGIKLPICRLEFSDRCNSRLIISSNYGNNNSMVTNYGLDDAKFHYKNNINDECFWIQTYDDDNTDNVDIALNVKQMEVLRDTLDDMIKYVKGEIDTID